EIFLGQRSTLVNDECMGEAGLVAGVDHVIEESVGVRIGERTMLAPALHIITTLDIVQTALFTPVRSRICAAFGIELDAERIAAAFCKKLELMRGWMITPNRLTQEMDAFDRRGAGASLRAVNPSVRPPRQAVRDGVSVFQPKAGEMNLR